MSDSESRSTFAQAVAAMRGLIKATEPRHKRVRGVLGDGAGNVVVPNMATRSFVRLHGADSRLVRALNQTGIVTEGIDVDVDVLLNAKGEDVDYRIVGLSSLVLNIGNPEGIPIYVRITGDTMTGQLSFASGAVQKWMIAYDVPGAFTYFYNWPLTRDWMRFYDNGDLVIYPLASTYGKVGIGKVSPTAHLHIGAGVAGASGAPLKIDAGTLLAAIENGAIETDGTHLYVTLGGVRYQIDQQTGTGGGTILPASSVVAETSYGQSSTAGTLDDQFSKGDHSHGTPSISVSTPSDISDTASPGSGATPSAFDHVHKGVLSVSKSGGTPQYGVITLSEGTNVAITEAAGNLEIAVPSAAPSGSAGGDLAGTFPSPTVKQSSTAFGFTGTISPASLGADQDNWNPTGLSGAVVIRITTSTNVNITGIAGGAAGRILLIHYLSGNTLTLKNASGSSSAANQIKSSADVVLAQDDCVALQYDGVSTYWRVLGKSPGGAGGGSGDVVGPSSAVDLDVAIFDGTSGKLIKDSGKTLPTGAIVGTTDSQTLTNKTLTTPTIGSFVNAVHDHEANAGGGVLDEDALALTDVTTNNVSTTKHGFAPKGSGSASTYLDGLGNYTAPSATGGGTDPTMAIMNLLGWG